MSSSTLRMVCAETVPSTLLATVELDRTAGVMSHGGFGAVEIVDHVRAWVLEGGIVLGATLRRSAVRQGRVLLCQDLDPVPQASLSAAERADVLHAAGLRMTPATEAPRARWEVA